jgi:hypothetical protein
LRPEAVDAFTSEISRAYHQRFGILPRIYPCRPSCGAGELKNLENIPSVD